MYSYNESSRWALSPKPSLATTGSQLRSTATRVRQRPSGCVPPVSDCGAQPSVPSVAHQRNSTEKAFCAGRGDRSAAQHDVCMYILCHILMRGGESASPLELEKPSSTPNCKSYPFLHSASLLVSAVIIHSEPASMR
jgi:hypothetical protein